MRGVDCKFYGEPMKRDTAEAIVRALASRPCLVSRFQKCRKGCLIHRARAYLRLKAKRKGRKL
jgi:hypothetical protein